MNKYKYIIFPSSYFEQSKIDEELVSEYEAVLSAGQFRTLIFGYDKWFRENELVLSAAPGQEASAVYRGWMMKPRQYADFYERLAARNIRLITSPAQYELFHLFPNIYPYIGRDTAKTLVFPDGEDFDLERVKREMPRFMVKDYVKSVKGTAFPQYFTADISREEFDKAMELFYKYRGELYTGGLCFKEYLELKRYGGKTNEYRIYIMNGELVSVSRNSLQPNYTAEFPVEFIKPYTELDSPFYTLDCAELADGSWKIIEAGDGQVSGLSDGQDPKAFYGALYHALGGKSAAR